MFGLPCVVEHCPCHTVPQQAVPQRILESLLPSHSLAWSQNSSACEQSTHQCPV